FTLLSVPAHLALHSFPTRRSSDLDRVGLDVFGIGEHHRAEFLDSAPVVILSAAATRTENIRLTSAVTVLSASDPVRVFQEFATLDRKSTRLNSSHVAISYAVFCLK